jgi:hypothetical protein
MADRSRDPMIGCCLILLVHLPSAESAMTGQTPRVG